MRGDKSLQAQFVQEQLRALDFPVVPAWAEAGPQPEPKLDGRSLTFGDARELRALVQYLERAAKAPWLAALPQTYIVLVEWDVCRRSAKRRFMNGYTVFAVGPAEAIRYQPVVVDQPFARTFGACGDGVLYEVDVPHISAWDGTLLPTPTEDLN